MRYLGAEDAVFAGGSYVIVQKYLHDVAGWNALSTEAQERIIGRTKLSDIELDDAVKPTSAHNALTTIIEDGKEIKIIRDNMPFGRVGEKEFGTYFIGYARSPRTIEQMLENMFVGRPPGNYDRLLDFSVAKTGNLFFVPSVTFLENVGDDAPPAGQCFLTRPPPRRHSRRRNVTARSVSVRLKETMAHEQPSSRTCPDIRRCLGSDRGGNVAHHQTLPRRQARRRRAGSKRRRHPRHRHRPFAQCRGAGDGILARQREVKALVELRVPFELDRQQIDDVERGANDSDWQPAKDAARLLAFAEDRAIFEGYAAAGIGGIREGTSNPVKPLPADMRAYPDAIAQALSQLRLVGVNGPYSVLLSADAYTGLSETSDNGYPVLEHIKRLVDGESSGLRRFPAHLCSRPAAAISACISARMCRSAT